MNEISGKNFRLPPASDTAIEFVMARMKSGISRAECMAVLALMWKKWRGTEMEAFFRPQTIFNKVKFEGYYAMLPQPKKEKKQAAPEPEGPGMSVEEQGEITRQIDKLIGRTGKRMDEGPKEDEETRRQRLIKQAEEIDKGG